MIQKENFKLILKISFANKFNYFGDHYKIHRLLYRKEHHIRIFSVIFVTRSAQIQAAVRLKTWNGVLSTIGKSNDCSYLQRQRVSSKERSYS